MEAGHDHAERVGRHDAQRLLTLRVSDRRADRVNVPPHRVVDEDARRVAIVVAHDLAALGVLGRDGAHGGQHGGGDPRGVHVDTVQDDREVLEDRRLGEVRLAQLVNVYLAINCDLQQ